MNHVSNLAMLIVQLKLHALQLPWQILMSTSLVFAALGCRKGGVS
jgi:hypothetical protein